MILNGLKNLILLFKGVICLIEEILFICLIVFQMDLIILSKLFHDFFESKPRAVDLIVDDIAVCPTGKAVIVMWIDIQAWRGILVKWAFGNGIIPLVFDL